MSSNRPPTRKSRILAPVTALLLAAGCHEYVNPFADEYVGPEWITTASVEGARSRPVADGRRKRAWESTPLSTQDGTVGHFPLWWEDPFEEHGSDDEQFAWTWEDYFAMPYGLGRFILNTIGVPVSATVEPPVPLMGSDGVTSRRLGQVSDPRWHPGGGSPTPPDILEIGVMPPNGGAVSPYEPPGR